MARGGVKRKMSAFEKRDAVKDKKQGIREGSARDVAMDRMAGRSTKEKKKTGY